MLIHSNFLPQSKPAELQKNSGLQKSEGHSKIGKNPLLAQDASEVNLASPTNAVVDVMAFSQVEESTRIARNDISSRFDSSILAHGNFDPKAILSLLE